MPGPRGQSGAGQTLEDPHGVRWREYRIEYRIEVMLSGKEGNHQLPLD